MSTAISDYCNVCRLLKTKGDSFLAFDEEGKMSQLRTIALVTESGSIDCLLRLSNYDIECKRIKLSLFSASGDEVLEISCNLPNRSAPQGSRQFFLCAKPEHRDLLSQLMTPSLNPEVLRVINPQPIPISDTGSMAYLAELLWSDDMLQV
jgi:hypothetical protein